MMQVDGFNPVVSFIRANGLLLSGRLRFPRGRVGEVVAAADGQPFKVFRQVIVQPGRGHAAGPGATFRVRFHVEGMSPAQNKRFSWLPVPFFIGLPGFRGKLWMLNEQTGDFQGVYQWATVEAAQRYAQSFAMRFMTRRSTPGSVSYEVRPSEITASSAPPRFEQLPRRLLRLMRRPPQLAYRLGLGPVIGRLVLLLTTTGRKTGLPRVTPLQYEEVDGAYYVGSARGAHADWFRNIVKNPGVEVRVKNRRFRGDAEAITDPARIAEFLQLRLARHPRMIGAMLRAEGLPPEPTRADLLEFASKLAMVVIHPHAEGKKDRE